MCCSCIAHRSVLLTSVISVRLLLLSHPLLSFVAFGLDLLARLEDAEAPEGGGHEIAIADAQRQGAGKTPQQKTAAGQAGGGSSGSR